MRKAGPSNEKILSMGELSAGNQVIQRLRLGSNLISEFLARNVVVKIHSP